MLVTLLQLARHAGATPAPAASAVSFFGTAGSCFAGTLESAAGLAVLWTVTNPDDALYETRIYENDVLVATQESTATSWERVVTGNVQDGPFYQWTSNWIYRVDVVRISDGVVISSAQSAAWAQLYGACGS